MRRALHIASASSESLMSREAQSLNVLICADDDLAEEPDRVWSVALDQALLRERCLPADNGSCRRQGPE